MKKKIKSTAVVILLAVIITCFAACGGPKTIVGKWQLIQNGEKSKTFLTFKNAGIFVLSKDDEAVCGTYELAEHQITLTYGDDNDDKSEEAIINLDGENLDITYDKDNRTEHYEYISEN